MLYGLLGLHIEKSARQSDADELCQWCAGVCAGVRIGVQLREREAKGKGKGHGQGARVGSGLDTTCICAIMMFRDEAAWKPPHCSKFKE